jgi:hypothetical protein
MSTQTLLLPKFPATFALHWQRCVGAWRRRRVAALVQRPDRAALRDLGIDASEWSSVLAESAGRTELTRRRVELVS